jgi:hypothetical protein
MSDEARPSRSIGRNLWEIFFALNLSYVVLVAIFRLSFETSAFFFHLEVMIRSLPHMPRTESFAGHLTYWIPMSFATPVLWALLRIAASSRSLANRVRQAAGMISVSSPLVGLASFYSYRPLRELPESRIALISEMAVALVLTWLFQSGRWKPPAWAGVLLLAAHFGMWWFLDPARSAPSAPAPAIFEFCAFIAWRRYLNDLRQTDVLGSPASETIGGSERTQSGST